MAVISPWSGFVLYVFQGSFSSKYLLIDRILDTADDFIYDGMNENYQDDFGNKELGVGMVDCFKAVGYDIVPNLSYSFQDLIPLNGDGDNLVNPGESVGTII